MSKAHSGQRRLGKALRFPHIFKRCKATFYGVERVLAGLMFDNIPLRFAWTLAECENFLPVDIPLTNNRLRPGAVRLYVNSTSATWIFLETSHRVRATIPAIAGVQLHNHLGICITKKQVPGGDAVDLFEV